MLRTLAARALGGASATTSGSLLSSSSTTSTAVSTTLFSSLFLSSSQRSYASSVAGSSEADFGIAAGVPEHLLKREGMSQTDSAGGLGKGACWRIEFETKQKWINPLMGWTSTADPYENVGRAGMSFDTAEAAAAFCKKHGWKFVIKEGFPSARLRPARFNQYGDNFSVKRKGVPDGGLVSENGGKVEVRKSSSSSRASTTASGASGTEGKSSGGKARASKK